MDNKHDISLLNALIETTLDSVKGYTDAAEDSHAGTNAGFFREMARERSAVASRLQSLVGGLGGDPQEHSSYTGAAHRGFMNLKTALTGGSERSVIEEVERGEDYLKAKYEAALKDGQVSTETRRVIEEAFQSVSKGHDRASALKHSLNA